MQILQWVLFKRVHEQEGECNIFDTLTKTEATSTTYKNGKGNDIIGIKHHRHRAYKRRKRVEESKIGCKNLKAFAFICGKDIPKACFYRNLNLNKTSDFVHSTRMMKRQEFSRGIVMGMGITNNNEESSSSAAAAQNVGNKKVLPISEGSSLSSSTNSSERSEQCRTLETIDDKDQSKGDDNKKNMKKKTISRMKEILRWAAAAKSVKRTRKFNGQKVLEFGRDETKKSSSSAGNEDDDEEVGMESPKISFSFEMESCSTTSSLYSSAKSTHSYSFIQNINIIPLQGCAYTSSRHENWITTDTEFVVLEL